MSKIQGFHLPDLDPDEAVEIANTIVNEFGSEVTDEEAFARSIGHSTSNSGAYYKKVADLRRYGILPGRGLQATELAKRIANPDTEADARQAKLEMMKHLDIVDALDDELDGKKPAGELWRVIANVTGGGPDEAREAAPRIAELYRKRRQYARDVASYNRPARVETADETGGVVNPSNERAGLPSSSSELYLEVGEDRLEFSDATDSNIQLTISFLESKLDDDNDDSRS